MIGPIIRFPMMGPNVNKLIAHKMSFDAIPYGAGINAALEFLTTPGALATSSRAATEWVGTALGLIRTAAEPNPWKDADDEAIAGELLRRIEARKSAAK